MPRLRFSAGRTLPVAIIWSGTPETDFATTNKNLKWVQDQLDFYNEEWEKYATELDALQKAQSAAVE